MAEIVVRPTPWAPPSDGFHFEAVVDEDRWRLATEHERDIDRRRCRSREVGGCDAPVVIALNRGRRLKSGARIDSWWFYCAEHAYGHWVEDGQVMHWRLVRDEDGAES